MRFRAMVALVVVLAAILWLAALFIVMGWWPLRRGDLP
jgi:hypothetical protein